MGDAMASRAGPTSAAACKIAGRLYRIASKAVQESQVTLHKEEARCRTDPRMGRDSFSSPRSTIDATGTPVTQETS